MRLTLILMERDFPPKVGPLEVEWPRGVRIPAVGERLAIGSADEPIVDGVVRNVTWTSPSTGALLLRLEAELHVDVS